ncbi:unnamed protein product [Caenorhabditis angaria]|uniref:Lipoprotein n=1 Tax=Caenorhabditis angaria TaxID=860376 RepID=A0A9P1N2L0_9PELO|nr:unnamed protein product [Caenorhabditis angaria]
MKTVIFALIFLFSTCSPKDLTTGLTTDYLEALGALYNGGNVVIKSFNTNMQRNCFFSPTQCMMEPAKPINKLVHNDAFC